MKKFLFAIILTAGFGLAAQAQSTSVASENEATPAKVEVAGQVSEESAAPQPAAVNATESAAPAKSCCSSKKGKDTASAKSKACCADGKKSKADCHDKKGEATISQ